MKIFLFILTFLSFSVFSAEPFEYSKTIDGLFKQWDETEEPGAALGIVKDGQLVYAKGYGIADLEHDIKITPSSVFYIGSVSKQFVTFSILLLVEQGKLDLDDKIQKYLPDFPEYESPLTIRHFIHHTSGVRDYLTLVELQGKSYLDHVDIDEVYDLIKRQDELNFSPGEKYLYSNSCYFMLAMIVEKAAGLSLREFADKHIFQPLGMNNTLFYDDNTDLIKNRVFSYDKKKGESGFNNLIMRFDLVGSGGVYSSIEDLFLWDQNFYNNKLGQGGQDIIEKMHEEGLLNNGQSSGYAFALNNGTYKGLKTVSHGGALAGYRAEIMRFPEEEFSVIVLANRSDANPTVKSFQVADILLKDKLIKKTVKAKAKSDESISATSAEKFSFNQISGQYEKEPGIMLEIKDMGFYLDVLQSWNQSTYKIVNTSGNTFEIPGNISLRFVFSELKNGFAQTLTAYHGDQAEPVYTRKEDMDLSDTDLADYVGTYYSDELQSNYKVKLEGEKLMVEIPNKDTHEMMINDVDTFTGEHGVIQFKRSEELVTGFELNVGRVKKLKFEKQSL